jgi:hypothetical protein
VNHSLASQTFARASVTSDPERYHAGLLLAEAPSRRRRGRALPTTHTGIRMKTMQRLFPLLVLTSVFACSSVEVEYAYGKASFSGFGSKFAWVEKTEEGNSEVPADILAFIHDTIERGLVDKHYAKAGAAADADFLVSYRVSKKFAIAATTNNDLTHYEEGALDVFVVAPKTSELMWHGTAHAAMDKSLTPSERHERLREGVAKMLKNFPDEGTQTKR